MVSRTDRLLGRRQRGDRDADTPPPPISNAHATIVGGGEPRRRPVRQPASREPDVAERLKALTLEQLAEVTAAFTDRVGDGSEAGMRKALVRYIKECGDDAAEDRA